MKDVLVKNSEIHGKGVFATKSFEKGSIVLILDDSRIVNKENPLNEELGEYDYHCDYLENGKTILQKTPERHINSSCEPNTFVKTNDGIRYVLARKPIKKNDEITYDYIINCHGGEVWQCRCGSKNCRETIVSSFFELPLEKQKEYLEISDTWFIKEHWGKINMLKTKLKENMRETLVEAIPEFDLIQDTDLREKTIQVWEDAVEEGGWNWETVMKMPFSVHVENCNITFIEHVRTVCKMCIAVHDVLKDSYGDQTTLDKDHLISGALLADVGKLIEYTETEDGEITKAGRGDHLRHPFIGVAMAHKRGIPPEVQHVIATHSKEGEMMVRSNESVIFHHADFIDFDLVSKKRPF